MIGPVVLGKEDDSLAGEAVGKGKGVFGSA